MPAAGIALPMKARNHQNAFPFNLVKQAIRKTPHSRPPSVSVDNWKLKRKSRDALDRIFDSLHKPL